MTFPPFCVYICFHVLIHYVSMFINSTMAIYIESIPNRNSPPAILLRYAKRNGKRIERKTLANLSKTPAFIVDAIRILLKGGVIVNSLDQAFTVHRSLPHGHVAALVSLASQIGLPRILHRTGSRQRDLALAAIIARIISPASKLATARALSPETADSSWALYSSSIPCTAMKCSICLTGSENGKSGSRKASPIATCVAAR